MRFGGGSQCFGGHARQRHQLFAALRQLGCHHGPQAACGASQNGELSHLLNPLF